MIGKSSMMTSSALSHKQVEKLAVHDRTTKLNVSSVSEMIQTCCSLITDHIQFQFVIRHEFSQLLNIKGSESGTTGNQYTFECLASNKMSIVF